MAAGHLVAFAELAALGDADADELVHSGREAFVVRAVEDLNLDDLAFFAVRDAQAGVLHLARFFAKDGAEELLLGRQLGLALGRDLADEDVAFADLGADADDAILIEVAQAFFADVRDVAGDLFGAELGVARLDFVLFDVDRGELVFADQVLRDDDRVFEVVALPAHERAKDVLAEGEVAALGAGAVRDRLVFRDAFATVHQGPMVEAGTLVRTRELGHRVADIAEVGVVVADDDAAAARFQHFAIAIGDGDVAAIDGGAAFHARAHEGNLGADERHGLALHVRAHEGAVRVVVFEERDERRRDRHHLLRGDVHEVDFVGRDRLEVAVVAGLDAVVEEVAVRIEQRVRLADLVLVFLVGGQVDDVVGDGGAGGTYWPAAQASRALAGVDRRQGDDRLATIVERVAAQDAADEVQGSETIRGTRR
ncbi:MAG: hypothetical protein IPH65_02925 [Dehalococcoidia bacterium]|nr:hypothetical protein [Dehalococcoidia bacterium]